MHRQCLWLIISQTVVQLPIIDDSLFISEFNIISNELEKCYRIHSIYSSYLPGNRIRIEERLNSSQETE